MARKKKPTKPIRADLEDHNIIMDLIDKNKDYNYENGENKPSSSSQMISWFLKSLGLK